MAHFKNPEEFDLFMEHVEKLESRVESMQVTIKKKIAEYSQKDKGKSRYYFFQNLF